MVYRGIDAGDMRNKKFQVGKEVLALKHFVEGSGGLGGVVVATIPVFHDEDGKEVVIYGGTIFKVLD